MAIVFNSPVFITAASSVAGPKEKEGPLGSLFDLTETDMTLSQESWEQAESELAKLALKLALTKAGLKPQDLDFVIAGDLLNQGTGTSFGLKDCERPFLGIFGACSAIGEGLGIGSMLVSGGFAKTAAVIATSHFCTAEKQFRFPLEFGAQRPPTASWTVTGAGGLLIAQQGSTVAVTAATMGRMVDMGIKDANNMGAAMAGAAADSIKRHLEGTGQGTESFDHIITGDLGYIGQKLLLEILQKDGLDISAKHRDCGIEIFDKDKQDTHAGGSGCACSAITFSALYYPKLASGELNRILFVPTGALMSPLTLQQGQSIPGIAHAIQIEHREVIS